MTHTDHPSPIMDLSHLETRDQGAPRFGGVHAELDNRGSTSRRRCTLAAPSRTIARTVPIIPAGSVKHANGAGVSKGGKRTADCTPFP
jgi:hypothetical protein